MLPKLIREQPNTTIQFYPGIEFSELALDPSHYIFVEGYMLNAFKK
jgi:hypothetical protein